ncbi:hypothetical protein CW304_23325 [Bacillus sp. UFRGS-B20]|nr:hypothetical protein CW304_23325 [Bacillus sp. UFRGS-B20]
MNSPLGAFVSKIIDNTRFQIIYDTFPVDLFKPSRMIFPKSWSLKYENGHLPMFPLVISISNFRLTQLNRC